MSFVSNVLAIRAIQKIKKGFSQHLSLSQIVNLLINLPDAKAKLSNCEFNKVYSLFQEYNSNKKKLTMNAPKYMETASKIICQFNKIAPYELYSGMDEFETKELLMQIQNSEVLTKASGLVYGVKGSIGDIFYKLNGQNAAIFSIIAISSAVKYYLDKNSTNNPVFYEISNTFVNNIANDLGKDKDSTCNMIKNITSFSYSFEERVAIAKNNFQECDEIELCGIAAAALFCNLQKDSIDISDESKMEMYFEMFKTVFVKLIESL